MCRLALAAFSLVLLGQALAWGAVEEHIIGVLETTVKPGACAQIKDALKETYYIVKTDESDKACKALIGKRVEVFGVVEERAGDPSYFFHLRRSQEYRPSDKKTKKVQPTTNISVPLPLPSKDSSKSPTGEPEKKAGGVEKGPEEAPKSEQKAGAGKPDK